MTPRAHVPTLSRALAIGLAVSVLPAQTAHAQGPSRTAGTSIDQAMEQTAAVRRYAETAISPDGKWVAWVETLPETKDTPSLGTAIFVAVVGSTAPARRIQAGVGTGPSADHGLAWSRDSRWLAFLSDAEHAGQLQLYVAPAASGRARRLTTLTGYLATPAWSPDGRTVAALFTENAPRAAGPLQPRTADVGVVESRVYEQRLTTVDVASGTVRQLSPADLYVYEYDWSPDGRQIVATAAHGEGDDNWYVAELFTIDAASGDTRSILTPHMQVAVPRWSPDGKTVAFIGGIMSDEGIAAGDIYTMPASGGSARNITASMKPSAYWLTWLSGPSRVFFAGTLDGGTGLGTVDAAGGPVRMQWTGAEKLHGEGEFDIGISLARDGRTTAVIRQSFAQPPEVWAGAIGGWHQVTTANHDVRPLWGEAKSVHWTSDQFAPQGWLVLPRDYDPSRRYPMVVWVHGGPAWATSPSWPETFGGATLLANQGYFVFFPNPRGSTGQGEAFMRANVKDFGYGDLRDILAGMTEVVHTYPVDSTRIGISGWSYGGYMTMWAITQTQRFRAAVVGAGLSNWLSYYGENGIDQWMIPYFGASVYDDPGVYARSAPITFIKNVHTPALIVVGDGDIECPPPQSYEYWHALKTFGVKTQMVIYPNEGHHIGQPEHQRDILRRMVAWFDSNMPASNAPPLN
jgi:dipeptidyl aminopeptidase/acylaminoacyl peptidase